MRAPVKCFCDYSVLQNAQNCSSQDVTDPDSLLDWSDPSIGKIGPAANVLKALSCHLLDVLALDTHLILRVHKLDRYLPLVVLAKRGKMNTQPLRKAALSLLQK